MNKRPSGHLEIMAGPQVGRRSNSLYSARLGTQWLSILPVITLINEHYGLRAKSLMLG